MAHSKKCLASIYDAPISSFLYSVAFGLIFLSNYVLGHHDIPHLSDNLAAAAENLEPALKNGSPDELKDAIANLLENYRVMEADVEQAFKAAGGSARNDDEAKEKAKKYYDLVDRIWKDGVRGKDAAHIKAIDLAQGAGAIGREMRLLSHKLDYSKLDDVDQILAHAEAILIMAEDLDLVAFGPPAAMPKGVTSHSASASVSDGTTSSSEEESPIHTK